MQNKEVSPITRDLDPISEQKLEKILEVGNKMNISDLEDDNLLGDKNFDRRKSAMSAMGTRDANMMPKLKKLAKEKSQLTRELRKLKDHFATDKNLKAMK